MASELITAQHTFEALLKFILLNDMMTVDIEMMTLTGSTHIEKTEIMLKNNFPLE